MRYFVFERYQVHAYQDFLKRLDVISARLIAARIDFDPGLTLAQIDRQALSSRAKYAWCLHRSLYLLRAIINGPPESALQQPTFFSQTVFYNRLDAALSDLDTCFKLFVEMSTEDIDHAQSFLLRVLVWELLQVLNPASCKQAQEISENLYHRSVHCKMGFNTLPPILHSKIRHFFHAQIDTQKIVLLEQIRVFNFHTFLQNDVTPEMICNALTALQADAVRFHQANHLPLILQLDVITMQADHKKRVDILTFLQEQLVPDESPISAALLGQHLNAVLFNVLDCFDSPVLEPNHYSYMKPADKFKFIFDAIVFRPDDNVTSVWSVVSTELFYALAPERLVKTTNRLLTPTSPGEAYLRTKGYPHPFTDLNSYLYDSLGETRGKKRQYQTDARSLIAQLLLRLESELRVKQDVIALARKITDYQINKTQLSQQILDLIGILTTRIQQISQYNDPSDALRQFEEMKRAYFGEDSLEMRCQQLHTQLEALTFLDLPKLDYDSKLGKDVSALHAKIQAFRTDNTILSLARQFSELLASIQRIEVAHQQEQAQFGFQSDQLYWGRQFPYLSILAFLLAAMGLAVAIGIATGNPYFACLVLPCLINYTMPICLLAMAVGTGVLLQSSRHLSRYQFFSKSPSLTMIPFLNDATIPPPSV